MAKFDGEDGTSRVRAEWDAMCRAAAPLCALWERDRNPRYGISRAARELGMTEKGLRDRLHRERLPPYALLHEWYLVVRLLEDARAASVSRCSWKQGREPSTHYRFLRRVTRQSLAQLQVEGVEKVRARAVKVWHSTR